MGSTIILFTALALSMDAFAVSIANGVSMDKLRIKNMLKFGLFFGIAQGVMTILGYFLGNSLLQPIMKYSDFVSFLILFLLGARMIYGSITNKDDEVKKCEDISTAKMCMFSIATSIDAMAIGVSFAIMHMEVLVPATVITVITFVMSGLGVCIGKKLGTTMHKWAEIFGGVVLVLIGFNILM